MPTCSRWLTCNGINVIYGDISKGDGDMRNFIRIRCIDDSGVDRRRETLRKGCEYEIDPRRDCRFEETATGPDKCNGFYVDGFAHGLERFEIIRGMDAY